MSLTEDSCLNIISRKLIFTLILTLILTKQCTEVNLEIVACH